MVSHDSTTCENIYIHKYYMRIYIHPHICNIYVNTHIHTKIFYSTFLSNVGC